MAGMQGRVPTILPLINVLPPLVTCVSGENPSTAAHTICVTVSVSISGWYCHTDSAAESSHNLEPAPSVCDVRVQLTCCLPESHSYFLSC